MENQSKFEGYAIVEIMGHQTVAGYVTTEAFGSVVMFRVVQSEVPAEEKTLDRDEYMHGYSLPAGSRVRASRHRAETYVGAASVYRMTPCTEAEASARQPVEFEVLYKAERKALATPEDHEPRDDDDEEMAF